MQRHRLASHSAEDIHQSSNLAHHVGGLLLLMIGVLAFGEALGFVPWASTAWTALVLFAGGALLVALYGFHSTEDWGLIWEDPEQRQHTIIAIMLVVAGAGELIRAGLAESLILGMVFPVAISIVGILFLTHAQHGTGHAVLLAIDQHRVLGITLIFAGVLRAAAISVNPIYSFAWPTAFLVASVQLFLYSEPEGTVEMADHPGHAGQSQGS